MGCDEYLSRLMAQLLEQDDAEIEVSAAESDDPRPEHRPRRREDD